jgi:hypothetical protein
MVIDGTVVDVMETWPLQLSIHTTSGLYHVVLSESTIITSEGWQPVDAGAVQPGAAVEVQGEFSGAQRMTVERLDVR